MFDVLNSHSSLDAARFNVSIKAIRAIRAMRGNIYAGCGMRKSKMSKMILSKKNLRLKLTLARRVNGLSSELI